jgi:hypothetical protein
MNCRIISGESSGRFATASRRPGRRADEACAKNRASEVHVALPQAGTSGSQLQSVRRN